MNALKPKDFLHWRKMARALIQLGIPPEEVLWQDPSENSLFPSGEPEAPQGRSFSVSPRFVNLAQQASLFRDPRRWEILYRVLWRLQKENKNLLAVSTDPDVSTLDKMAGEIRRDCHKMKAFVRFRKDATDTYVAWHEPTHLIVEAVAPFFARRFSSMDWAILTPDCSAYWNQKDLKLGPGVSRSQAPDSDSLEELWKTYYANIFNPARIKLQAMVSEMPKKYWHTMPETALIHGLLLDAPRRVEKMMQAGQSGLVLPEEMVRKHRATDSDLSSLRALALGCQACELCHSATQTVFGNGPQQADIVFVGEQPGDHEDRVGLPFVGPAGKLFRTCLERVGWKPEDVYLTNVVKHFPWKPAPQGKRRLHQRATWEQIDTCKPWVKAEIALIKPKVVILLGVTALQALLDKTSQIGQNRGRPLESDLAPLVLATVHPSSLLRMKDSRQQQLEIDKFCRDLRLALDWMGTLDLVPE